MRLFVSFCSLVAWAACVAVTLEQVTFGGGISTQLPQTSFIDVPQSPAFAQPNTTAEFVWKMDNCILHNKRVKLLTQLYDLYPIANGPIKTITDYNVTAECRDNSTIVTLSITFNENVLENAEYVICRVTRLEDREIVLTHTVNFSTTEPNTNPNPNPNPSTETASNSESSSAIQSTSNSSVTVMSTSGSGCNGSSVHFSALVLCFFVANFQLAFSWKSCNFLL